MTFVPPAGLGPFTFPAPWNSQAIRLTNASNAPNGCEPRIYPYWSCVNNHKGRAELFVFIGRRGQFPIILVVNKATGHVETKDVLPWDTTGEGIYWSDADPDLLYFLQGPALKTFKSGNVRTVAELNPEYGDDLWQAHSSADDTVHSATVRRRTTDGPYEVLGCVVFRQGQQSLFFQIQSTPEDYDECIVDKSGRWLIVQEKVNGDRRNRIHDLRHSDSPPRIITDLDGALGHLDVGDGIIVGEDDRHEPGALVKWDLENPHSTRELVWRAADWGPGLGHGALRAGRVLLSSNWSGELLDVSLKDGTYRVIAPGMIAAWPPEHPRAYDTQLRACFDPPGEYACWASNMDVLGGRVDVFLVRVSPPQANPPIIIKPGGVMTYEAMGGDAAGQRIGTALFADYAEAGKAPDDGMAIWFWRTAFDALSMSVDASIRKHRREWRTELGLNGGAVNP